ncbi:YeeE/YedE family protein [Massilia sp. TS11]|uniref:YeeE/YedE family protein n=1 Tax=Massilia sp. TS11 TaxID=2908003 RepID=UPI001EDAA41B|nr:YeeE/YedE family protein [Massilia sp. TS11]MCG2583059.1 YeeE/YedE family protein [Massilia sp. TS11]
MLIDFQHFTPGASLLGGLLIGTAAGLYILGLGRIVGISGTVGGVLDGATRGSLQGQGLRLAFIAGMLAMPWLWAAVAPLPPVEVPVGPGSVLAAGLLVGIGTRMGNGCTSGHGVCGLSRLSRRSAAYVACFMGAGFVTAWLRHFV